MRIRKHAKISPLLPAAVSYLDPVSTATQTHHLCQLNQSPWDVVTFPLPPPHDDGDSAILSLPPPPLLDAEYFLWWGVARRTAATNTGAGESRKKKKKRDDNGSKLRVKKKKGAEEVVLCSKTDTKGWQCGEIVKNGNPFCDYHLSRRKKNVAAAATTKSNNLFCKKSGAATITKNENSDSKKSGSGENRRRRKSSNALDFYYYSGFGPKWGKKRGTNSSSESAQLELYGSSASDGGDAPRCSSKNATNVFKHHDKVCSGLSDFDENAGCIYEIEDEFDDDDEFVKEDGNGGTQKKRFRKPIKARSLKSLM